MVNRGATSAFREEAALFQPLKPQSVATPTLTICYDGAVTQDSDSVRMLCVPRSNTLGDLLDPLSPVKTRAHYSLGHVRHA